MSVEVQLDFSRYARVSVLKDEKIQKEYGQDTAEFKNKNMVAFTKPKLASIQPFKYKFVGAAHPAVYISQAFEEVVAGKDINTALREANEKLTKTIKDITQ